MRAYLVEAIHNTRPWHHVCGTLHEAESRAASYVESWLMIDGLDPKYDPAVKEQVKALLKRKKYAKAIKAWNEHFTDHRLGIREVEITERNCHHGLWHVVERDSGDLGRDHVLVHGLGQALETVKGMMTQPPCRCKRTTWKEVWRLLREGKIADAIDAWNHGKSTPTFAIHQIRLV